MTGYFFKIFFASKSGIELIRYFRESPYTKKSTFLFPDDTLHKGLKLQGWRTRSYSIRNQHTKMFGVYTAISWIVYINVQPPSA